MRLLFIPREPGVTSIRSTIWSELDRYAEVDTLELPETSFLLGRDTGPANLAECMDLARSTKLDRYDYVIGHANSLMWLSVLRLAGVATPFAIAPNFNHVHRYSAYALAMASQLRGPNDILFTGSRASQKAFERFGFRCLPYHAPGVPLDDFRRPSENPTSVRQQLGISSDLPVMLYTGRLQPDKSIGQLILSHYLVKQTHPAHLVISYHLWHEEYEREIRALGDKVGNVSFVKDPPLPLLSGLYQMADLFVLFGVSEFETFGRSPVEAMACGAVPVVPLYDGFVDNIPHGAGALVRTYGDIASRSCTVPEFAEAVIELLSRPERLAAMKHQCMLSVEGFDSSACLERFVRILSGTQNPGSKRTSTGAQVWSGCGLPEPIQAMTRELEGRPLSQLLSDFLSTKEPLLDNWKDHFMPFRRAWFSSFFPDA